MTDLSQKRELSNQAKELLDNPAFTSAILQLRKRWFDELMHANTDFEISDFVSRLKALEAIPTELALFINDYKMELKKQGNG